MKKEVETTVVIPIKGLPSGVFSTICTLEHPFFDQFGNDEIREAHVVATIDLEKQPDSIRFNVALKGSVVRSCDRCLQDVTLSVVYNAPIVVKFNKTDEEEDSDEMFVLDPTATEVDLTQYIYDSVCTSLPLQTIHPAGQCDPEMEQKIAALTVN